MKALEIANYFISNSSKEDESDLTNLKLQKILYFAQCESFSMRKRELFEDEIEAWDLGPVVRDVYMKYKHCGAFPITVFDMPKEVVSMPESIKVFLNYIWDKYGVYSASQLVDLTHGADSPWSKNFKRGSKEVIPIEDLKTLFKC